MLKYEEREYIQSIYFSGSGKLKKGDFPMGGILKEIEFCCNFEINCKTIPYGVEIIKLSVWNSNETNLKELPSTIHTMTNVFINKKKNNFIPSNIKSISFLECPDISGKQHEIYGCITIPNTVREVGFSYYAFKYSSPLKVGDIPYGVTCLELHNRKFDCIGMLPSNLTSLKTTYNIGELGKLVLPNSLKHLDLNCLSNGRGGDDGDSGNGLFDFLLQTQNIESLVLRIANSISNGSNLFNKNSIKKLKIDWIGSSIQYRLSPNSLPSSNLEDLQVVGNFKLVDDNDDQLINTIPDSVLVLSILPNDLKMTSKGVIPNNVHSLTLNHCITGQGIFPNSLKSLNLTKNYRFVDDVKTRVNYTNDELVKMISNLPKSVVSLSLPKNCKQFNLQLSNSIVVYYLNNKHFLN